MNDQYHPPPYPAAINDSDVRMMITDRDQHVIVVPDPIPADPADTSWLTESNVFICSIYVLGRPLSYMRYSGISRAYYHKLLLKMIAAGVRVVLRDSLDEVNNKYLEIYPDAGADMSRRAKPFYELTAPFEMNVPANTTRTMDIPWPAEGNYVFARIYPMHDEGQAWGLGLALAWPDGQYVQINARTDGCWGIRRNGEEYLCGTYAKGKPAIVSIHLNHKRVELNAEVEKSHQYIAEFPRNEFPRAPAIVRVGKIGKTWNPQNSEDQGPASPCRVDLLRIF